MPLRFLLDEHFRGLLWNAVLRHDATDGLSLDVVCVGDDFDLPLGAPDPEILIWAEREERLLVSRDYHTMPRHFGRHLQSGRHSPGVLLVTHKVTLRAVVETLEIIAYTGRADQFADSLRFIP